jgi:hypothetical protein
MLTAEAHAILIAALSEASGKQVWFVTQPNDPEADSFQFEIEDAFLQSGWKIAASSKHTRPLQAGLRVYVADTELPDHVSVAVSGLRDIAAWMYLSGAVTAPSTTGKKSRTRISQESSSRPTRTS